MGRRGGALRRAVRLLLRLPVVHRRAVDAGASARRCRRMDAAIRPRPAAPDGRDSLLAQRPRHCGLRRRGSRSARCRHDLLRIPAGPRGVPRRPIAALEGSRHRDGRRGNGGARVADARAASLSEAVAHSGRVAGRPRPADAHAVFRDPGNRDGRSPDRDGLHRRRTIPSTTARPRSREGHARRRPPR